MILLLIVTGSFLYLSDQQPSDKTVSAETAVQLSNSQPTDQKSDVGPKVDNIHYLFDLVDHDPEQIKQLLKRAESLSKTADAANQQSRIAMVIHGPDIEFFDKKNYDKNKELIDLAARLDASKIIDFNVCKRALFTDWSSRTCKNINDKNTGRCFGFKIFQNSIYS